VLQQSLFESNFRPVPIEVSGKRPLTSPPENFEQLTFLEKLMYTGKNSPARVPKSPVKSELQISISGIIVHWCY
jgi:hypothetical protein